MKQVQLQNEVNELVKKMQAHQIGADVFEEKLAALMKDYKDEVKTKYILQLPIRLPLICSVPETE